MADKKRIHPHHRARWHVNVLIRMVGASGILLAIDRVAFSGAALSALFLPFLKFVEYLGTESHPILKWLYDQRFGAIFVLLGVQSGCQILRWLLGFAHRVDIKKVEDALNNIVTKHLGGSNAEHEYRATLFKKRSFPGLGEWLGMVARSGEKYRRLRTIFSVHNDNHHQNTGLAGECYWQGRTLIKVIEPLDDDAVAEVAEKNCQNYKKSTFLADEEFDCMTVKSCVFLVTCIKRDGKKWGVLILDSTDPKSAPSEKDRKARTADLEHTAAMLSMLLK